MKKIRSVICILLIITILTLTLSPCCFAAAQPDNTYSHVVVIGVDGAGAFFKDTDTPNIDAIFEDGAKTYTCLTSNPTISEQCWGSLLHGVTPAVHKLTNSIAGSTPYPTDSKFPSFFRVIRENDGDAVLASFSHWKSINKGIIEDNIGVHKVSGLSDSELTDEIVSYLENNAPTAMFVQFDEADGVGHSVGYGTEAHYEKITEIDGYIGSIYDAYGQKGILDDTLFIVTSDHGGSGTSHGGLSNTEKYVMFAAAGKTVQSGEIGDIEIRDTAAIVLHALGYTAPETWTARVPSGLFEGVTAGERPVYVDTDSERYHEPEPTPEKNSDGYVTNFIKNHTLTGYLDFDGDITDACGGSTSKTGNLYFVDGYFGNGVALDDGYVSINNYAPGKDSFTVALWLKLEEVATDPLIFSNKDWSRGRNAGFALAPTSGRNLRFNLGDGTNRVDCDSELPADYSQGWMHVIAVVDREADKIGLCYDFGTMTTEDIPQSLQEASLTTAFSKLNIGQDATGNYDYSLPATVDELMIFKGAFGAEEIRNLAKYYGKVTEFRDNEPAETPQKNSTGYISHYITDKELDTYLTFDGSVGDSTGNSAVSAKGTVNYKDGFFGKGIDLSQGYVSIADHAVGTDSFSAAFWIKTDGVDGDPIIVSNKDWSVGKNKGFAVSLRESDDLRVDISDGTNRTYFDPALPNDYSHGWVYVVIVYDRENGQMRVSYDFKDFQTYPIRDELANVSANGCTDAIIIGQDGTGEYEYPLTATLDEFMLFKGALEKEDIQLLSEYFGITENSGKSHSFNEKDSGRKAEDATCKAPQKNYVQCDNCDAVSDTLTIEVGTKADHVYENYVSNNDATCEDNCTETGKCKWCKTPDTRDIADSKVNHKFENYVSNNDATCCDDGTKTAKCKWCDEKDTVADANTAKGHGDTTKVFKDVATGKWYVNAINYNYTHKFISGMKADEFGVNTEVTRGMFITILARIAGVDTANNKVTTKFTDVETGKYYTNAIKWASENKIVNGMTDTTFAPNAPIQRQQLCVMIVNFANHMKIELKASESAISFKDASGISNYAKDAVKTAQMADIVNGYANGDGFDFRATNTATRAEAAQILYKFHKDFVA